MEVTHGSFRRRRRSSPRSPPAASAASRELRTLLPTVCRKVAELETSLDVKLLVRDTRKLALTEVGDAYLGACRQIVEELAEAERGTPRNPPGLHTLRLRARIEQATL